MRVARLGYLVCSLLTCGLARAEGAPRATLVVTRGAGAEDCPDAEGIAQRVASITGTRTLQTQPFERTDTWVHLELTRDFGRYAALLQLRGQHQGSRALSDVGADCSSLADAVAVALALSFDANAAPAPPALAPKQATAPSEERAAPTPEPPRKRYAVQLGGGIGLGVLEGATPVVTLGIDVTPKGVLRVGLGGGLTRPERVYDLNGFTELQLTWGYARGCAEAARSRAGLQLTLCIAPWLGALSGAGYGYDFTAKKRWFWAALTGGAQLGGPLANPSFWWLSANAIVPLTLRGFAVTGGGKQHDVFTVPRFGAIASLGLGVEF